MIESLISNILHCNKNFEEHSTMVLLATFLISYIIFNYLFKTDKLYNINDTKNKMAENYLRQHEKEDKAFFTGEEEDNQM